MKVITGKYKNRNLLAPKTGQLRITTGLVKKVCIDIYNTQIEGARVLDLFAGSGNVGIEFLSNNADYVTFIEFNKAHYNIIKKNLAKLGIDKSYYDVINNDITRALKYLNNKYTFDFIFMDPPYKENLVNEIIQEISKVKIYNKDTVIIAEHHIKEKTDDVSDFIKIDSRKYGATILDFYKII